MVRINYKPNNLNESLLPVLVLNWIFGHQIMQYTMGSYKFIQSFFYFILVVIVYTTAIVHSVLFIVNAKWFKHSETVYFIVVATNVLIMVINLILGWIHRNKTLSINVRSLNVDKKLKAIGASLDKKRAFIFATNLAIYWLVCSLGLNLLATSWSKEIISFRDNVLMIFSIHQPIHVNFLIDLLFCLLLRNMEIRFKQINNELLKLELLQYSSSITNIRVNENRSIYVLPALKEIHFELKLLCDEITQVFGLQLITSMASLFVLLTAMSYNLWITAVARNAADKLLRVPVMICWIVIHSSKLMFINHTCSRTVNEWKNTGVIIHQLETKIVNAQICKILQQFSIQMIQSPLRILPLGFLELGHSFMQGFFGTIATYLIIFIQMAPPEKVSL